MRGNTSFLCPEQMSEGVMTGRQLGDNTGGQWSWVKGSVGSRFLWGSKMNPTTDDLFWFVDRGRQGGTGGGGGGSGIPECVLGKVISGLRAQKNIILCCSFPSGSTRERCQTFSETFLARPLWNVWKVSEWAHQRLQQEHVQRICW